MDSSSSITHDIVAKFSVKDKPLYVKLLWEEDDKYLFDIKVFYEDKSWTGKYSKEVAAERRERLDETEEEYNSNIKDFFNGNSNYNCDFTVSAEDINKASFIWKKQYEGSITKLHGIVSMQCDGIPTSKDKLIDILLEKNNHLKLEVDLAKEKNNVLKQDLDQYIHRLEELTESKILLETTLYGRFVQVLNEKKRRIKLLEECCKTFDVTE